MSYPPTFDDGDMSNLQTASVEMGLAKPVDIRWGLYGQGWWAWRKQRKAIIASGIEGYTKKEFPSDGYTFYADFKFNDLKGDGDQIGLSIPLPNGDGTDAQGFGWQYDLAGDSYTDFSYFVKGATSKIEIDVNFLCGNTAGPTKDTHIGYCYNVLPKQKFSDTLGSGAVYRWHAEDVITPLGWTNISGKIDTFDLSDGEGVTLLGASTLISQIAAASAVLAVLYM